MSRSDCRHQRGYGRDNQHHGISAFNGRHPYTPAHGASHRHMRRMRDIVFRLAKITGYFHVDIVRICDQKINPHFDAKEMNTVLMLNIPPKYKICKHCEFYPKREML
jgi:hypothetical protein